LRPSPGVLFIGVRISRLNILGPLSPGNGSGLTMAVRMLIFSRRKHFLKW
jgi:hypothetical protein